MPDPKDNQKATGDVHPPEVEEWRSGSTDDADTQPTARDGDRERANEMARERQDEARAGKGENQAGFLKDKDGTGHSDS